MQSALAECGVLTAECFLEPACWFFLVEFVFRSGIRAGQYSRRWLAGWTGNRISVLVDLHSQTETHLGEDFFDLVQRLASEVLRLQHLGFGFLNQFADRLNVSVLQAVVAADRQLQLFDRAIEIFVADLSLAIFCAFSLVLFLEVDEDRKPEIRNENLNRSVEGLELSVRSYNCSSS